MNDYERMATVVCLVALAVVGRIVLWLIDAFSPESRLWRRYLRAIKDHGINSPQADKVRADIYRFD